MATNITNNSRKPLSIPLRQGKKLFLGPGKTGAIGDNDVDSAPVKALLESGDIEIVNAKDFSGVGGKANKGHAADGHSSGGGPRRSGDR